MGIRAGLHYLRSLFDEYRNVFFATVFGFIFLVPGVVFLRQTGLPGVIFIAAGLFLFVVAWYDLKQKGTPAYGKTIILRPDEMPAGKRWVLYGVIVLVFLVICWLIIGGLLNGTPMGPLCIGECEY